MLHREDGLLGRRHAADRGAVVVSTTGIARAHALDQRQPPGRLAVGRTQDVSSGGAGRREDSLELDVGQHVCGVAEAELAAPRGVEGLEARRQHDGPNVKLDRLLPLVVQDGARLTGFDTQHTLRAAGAVQTASGLRPCFFRRVNLFDFTKIGHPLFGCNLLRVGAGSAGELLLKLGQVLFRERIGALLGLLDALVQGTAGEVVVDCRGGPFAVGHRVDHARRSRHHVSPGKNPAAGGRHRQLVGLDGAPAGRLQAEQLGHLFIGRLAHRRDQGLGGDEELRSFHRHGPPASAGVRFAKLHADTLHGRHSAVLLLQDDPHRGRQVMYLDSLVDRGVDFRLVGGHLPARAAIDDRHLFGAQPSGSPRRVDGRVSPADDHYPFAEVYRLAERELAEEIDAVNHVLAVFAGDFQLAASMRAGGHEDCVKLLLDLFDRHVVADGGPRAERYSQRTDRRKVPFQDVGGQPVIGNPHRQHTA